MLKGHSPYTGPFQVVKVLRHYSYLLSDGQKWNLRLLKHYLPLSATWTELLGLPLPAMEGNRDSHRDIAEAGSEDAVGGEEGTGEEGHRYPD